MKVHIPEELPLDLKLIVVYLLLTVVFLTIPPLDETIIRTILGIPMVLFIPGYVLIAALFPGRDDIDGIERAALSFGLSIAIVPLLGLGLNFTPWGIRIIPIIVTLVIFSLLLWAIAYFRRLELPQDKRFEVPLKAAIAGVKEEFARQENRTDRILTLILVLSIVFSLITLVYVIVTPKQGEKFTEFYILGASGKASDYPREVSPGVPVSLIAGIVNHEYSGINYTLRVQVQNITFLEKEVQLGNNQTWENPITFAINRTDSNLKLEFLLFREGTEAPYRETHLWVNSTVASTPAVDTTPTPTPIVVPGQSKSYSVKMDVGHGFNPAVININRSDTIVWSNEEQQRDRIVLVSKEGLFENEIMEYTKKTSYRFNQSGTYNFILVSFPSLKEYPNVTGSVIVK